MEEQRIDRIPAPPGRAVRWTVAAAAVLLAVDAQAQTAACDQLKTSLAAPRMNSMRYAPPLQLPMTLAPFGTGSPAGSDSRW